MNESNSGGSVIPFLKAVISKGTKSTKRKRKLKTILQDIVLSDALYVSLTGVIYTSVNPMNDIAVEKTKHFI